MSVLTVAPGAGENGAVTDGASPVPEKEGVRDSRCTRRKSGLREGKRLARKPHSFQAAEPKLEAPSLSLPDSPWDVLGFRGRIQWA